jgi:DNA repair photolyase
MELRDPSDFERKIFVKEFHREAFQSELRKLAAGEKIALGTATDPYQPAERRYRITRAMLEVFAECSGYYLGITTKSDLIPRDIDLLREVARRHVLTVYVTVTTMDRELARLLEPLAPRPDLRIGAVRKLARAGIRVRVGCTPILPLINDSELSMDEVARASAQAGAAAFGGGVVFLKQCAKAVFLPFLEERFPALAGRYKERFGRSAYLRGDYPKHMEERLERIRRRYGLNPPPEEMPELWPHTQQLSLF